MPTGRNPCEQMRIDRGWPTPNAMRSTADALDRITPARYGDVLRWVADLCDDAGPIQEVRRLDPTIEAEARATDRGEGPAVER